MLTNFKLNCSLNTEKVCVLNEKSKSQKRDSVKICVVQEHGFTLCCPQNKMRSAILNTLHSCSDIVTTYVSTLKGSSVSVCFRGISRLPSAFVFLRWFKLAHISIQVCNFHDGCKQGIYLNKDWGCVILREIDFLLKICWSIPSLHKFKWNSRLR